MSKRNRFQMDAWRKPSQHGISGWMASLLWVLTVVVIAVAILMQRPPVALDASVPATQFSAARALAQLSNLAQRPHPLGSADHERVREALVSAFKNLGANVHVETGTGVFNAGPRRIRAGTVHNIVADFAGTNSQKIVMLTAHYDSVPYGPGAGDDGAGVVSILEAMRALRAGPPLRNDVRVLITDGEESGLLGAEAYVSAHPQLAQQVGVVLNFEARGSSGPVMMFETSDGNGWLIGQLARAAPYPMASSLTYTLYKHMPNDTDLTVFKRAGLAGLNFAFVGTFQDYHTPLDTLAHLDPDTVQHMGSYALALTRQFGHADFTASAAPDQIYFNWLGSFLVHYPLWVVWVLLLLAAALWLLIARITILRNEFNKRSLLLGFAGLFISTAVVMAGMVAVWWALHAVAGARLLFGDTRSNEWLISGLVLVGIAMALWVQCWFGVKRVSHTSLLGGLLGFGLLSAAVSIALPGGSFLFEWPLLAALVGAWLATMTRQTNLSALWAWLAAVPAMLLFAPLLQNLLITLGMNVVAVLVIALLLGLACGVAAPLLARLSQGARWAVPLLLLAAVACLLVGLSQSHFSAQHPQRASLLYSINTDDDVAAWLSWDARPDAWTQHLLGKSSSAGKASTFLLGSQSPVLTGPAPLLPLSAPQMSVRSDTTVAGVRTLDVHIDSPRHAPLLRLRLSASMRLQSLAWNNQPPLMLGGEADPTDAWQLTYAGLPASGVDLQLRLLGDKPLDCYVGDVSYGLPKFAGQPAQPVMVVYGNAVMVSKRCVMTAMPPALDGPAATQ